MKFKFFKIPAIFSEDATKALDNFCVGHKVTNLEKQFVSNGNDSFWSICVIYMDDKPEKIPNTKKKESAVDYRDELSEEDFLIYAKFSMFQNSILEC